MQRIHVEPTGVHAYYTLSLFLDISGGNKRKLNTAVALVGGPSIVLLVSILKLLL